MHIDMNCLPKTFQYAIEITRNPNVRYLWIDALCVIQPIADYTGDWEEEIPLIGNVYRNSTCIIAASGAQTSDRGCFARRDVARSAISSFTIEDDKGGRRRKSPIVFGPTLPAWSVAVENSPLSERAWVLQERMMTPRTLFCTKDDLFWECKESHTSEFESICASTRNDFPLLEGFIKAMRDHIWGRRHDRKGWIGILRESFKKELSDLTDKLSALAGVASEIAAAQPDQEYLGGIWRSNLVEELAWAADYTNKIDVHNQSSSGYAEGEPPINRISNHPTWSWASKHFGLFFRPGRYAKVHTEVVEIGIGPAVSRDPVSAQGSHLCTMTTRGRLRLRKISRKELSLLGSQIDLGPCIFEPRGEFADPRNQERELDWEKKVILIDIKNDLDRPCLR